MRENQIIQVNCAVVRMIQTPSSMMRNMPGLSWTTRCAVLVILSFLAVQVEADKDVVANLQLSPSLDMIDASWGLVNATGDVWRYHVTWVSAGGSTLDCYVDIPSTNTSACDLRPSLASCTLYTVTVQPQMLEVQSVVDIGTPASAAAYTLPEDVSISSVQCTVDDLSISVTWQGPGECVEYEVTYTGTVLWGDGDHLNNSTTTRNLAATFTDLVPYTQYFFVVNAEGADGEASCDATTPETKPSAPTDVTVTNISTTSAAVAWSPPDQANGQLWNYTVTWSAEADSGGTVQTNDNATSYLLESLHACTNYTVQVAASTGAGKGEYSTPVDLSTDEEVPPPVTDLSVTDTLSRNVTLTWTRPNTSCDVISYTVISDSAPLWGEMLEVNNTSVSMTDFNDTNVMEVELSGLVPYSNYSITVQAATRAGDGDAAGPVLTQTKEDIPTEPTNLVIALLTNSSATVTWEPPEEENGIITNYTVRWRLANSTEAEDVVTVAGDQLSYEVPDMQKCQLYVFSLAASTSVGQGPEAVEEGSSVGDVEAPVVQCSEEEGYVVATWETPDTDSECNITSYNVSMHIKVLWSGEEHSSEQSVGLLEIFLDENVESYANYSFGVKALLAGGVIGPAGSCTVKTNETSPSQPQNLASVGATSSSLSLQWEPPAELNGVLRSYIVSWRVNGSAQAKENRTVDATDELPVYSTSISGLSADKTYDVEVQGVTVEPGEAAKGTYLTEKASSESTSVAGIVIGCIFGILLLVAIIVAFIKRDYIQEKYKESTRAASTVPALRPAAPSIAYSPLPEILDTIDQFERDPAKLAFAYEDLKARSSVGSTSVAEARQNMYKNRYFNILPFDRTRVVLRSDGESGDYINASYVKDWCGKVRFIACQGPKEETVDDFWSMIWQENVRIIVMLANCEEGGKQKCAKYWPSQSLNPVPVGRKRLKLEQVFQEGGHVRRKFCLEAESTREITQFHFTSWPDFGVPSSESALLSLVRHVRAKASPGELVVVHCSAGVGRTGTFITLWNLQESNEHKEVINVDDAILRTRTDRKEMVQSKAQYLYVFKCIAEYLRSSNTPSGGGISNRGYEDTENIGGPNSHRENTPVIQAPSNSTVPPEYVRPRMSIDRPKDPAVTNVQGSRVAPNPSRENPPPPLSPPPPLPPLSSNQVKGFEPSQGYSSRDPPSLPPNRPPRLHSPNSQDNHRGGHSGPSGSSRPPLPPRPPPGTVRAQPRPRSLDQYYDYPRNHFIDTDV